LSSKFGWDYTQHVKVYGGFDAWDVASELGRKLNCTEVMLLNGANRSRLGNHWFGDGAEHAIDENLHRGSADLACISYWLNNQGAVVRPDNYDLFLLVVRLYAKDKGQRFWYVMSPDEVRRDSADLFAGGKGYDPLDVEIEPEPESELVKKKKRS